MDSLAEFRVSHRARLAALFGQSVAEGLGAYRLQLEQSTYDPAVLASALFGELPEEGPVRDDLPSWSEEPMDTAARPDAAPEEPSLAQVTQTTPDDYVDTIPSETYANPEDGLQTACAADTGGVFGGVAAVPSPSAAFGGKPASQNKAPPPPLPADALGSQASGSGQAPPQFGTATAPGTADPVSKKATQKRPPVVPPSGSTDSSSTTSKPPGAPAREPQPVRSPPPKRPSNEWGRALPSDYTGDAKGRAVPVRGAEDGLPAWAPLVAADGQPYHTSPPDYWDLTSVCRVRCPVCFSGMCSRRNLKGFRRAHSRHRCHSCTQQGS